MTGAKSGTVAGITTTVNPDGTLTSNGTATGLQANIWLLGGYNPVNTDNVLFTLQAGKTYYISDVVLYMGTDRTAQNKLFVDPAKYPEGFKVTGVRHAQIDSGTVLTNKVYYPRVILGDTDTGWEPYRGHTATITSDRPLTKWDKLTRREGVWGWVYGGAITVLDGTETDWHPDFIAGQNTKRYLKRILSTNLKIGVSNEWLTSHFNYVAYGDDNIGFTGTNDNYNLFLKTQHETVEDLKAWLSANNVTVVYPVANPVWIPLTASEQAAMNALCTYAGTTHIWTDDPLQPVISLDYTVDTETYISSVMGGLRFAINPGDMGLDIIY